MWEYYFFLAVFSVLLVLQVWAIVKIRQLLKQILGLHDEYQKLRPSAPEKKTAGKFRHTCQICRHRQTFLDPAGKQVFEYRCGVSQQRIKLEDYCEKFEFDPHIADI